MRIANLEIDQAELFETVVQHFPDLIHSVDADGRIVYANKRAEDLLGYPIDRLLTMNIRDVYDADVLDQLEQGFDRLKQTGETSVESVLKDARGDSIPVEIRSFGIYDDQGRFLRTFSIMRDIRRLKQLRQELIHAGRLAAIGELSSGIVHDLNNPISVITLSLQSIQMLARRGGEGERLSPEVQECLEDIHQATISIRELVDHLRKFARGETSRWQLVDLGVCLGDALFLTKSQLLKHGVKIRNQVESGRCFVHGRPHQLQQVFANLLSHASNALSGIPNSVLSIEARDEMLDAAPVWTIRIRHPLPGGLESPTPLSAESFFADPTPEGSTTGLGFSITQSILEDHAGRLEFGAESAGDATWIVRLPQFVARSGGDKEAPP